MPDMKNDDYKKGYEDAMIDAYSIVSYAREQGETDVRQVLNWLGDPEYVLEQIEEDE
ncbi:hypothetical protein HCB26_06155 [Listeria booriae]|uniref:Uncharacterized protein n=1 Tax=Listeria booriae TaxID=1552123 RepID=A0A7X1D4W2_9LIST|nr:hypothetical protein [Listeria booriae]MBC2104041.1 hypothetical protein [Listeria booriae]MBC2166148.1 hypothetical protein [Listeria booriae]